MAAKKKTGKKAKKAKATVCGIKLPDFKDVKVTQKHISDGEPDNPQSCAIALSVIETLEKAGLDYEDLSAEGDDTTFTCITPVTIPIYLNGKVVDESEVMARVNVNLRLGSKANEFVQAFDAQDDNYEYTKKVKPTTFKAKPRVDVDLAY